MPPRSLPTTGRPSTTPYDGDTLPADTTTTRRPPTSTARPAAASRSTACVFENDNTGLLRSSGPAARADLEPGDGARPADASSSCTSSCSRSTAPGSRAAAERLVQLPPEAIDALTADESAAVRNFNVPADGASAVPALPALTGRVEGRAFEGDHVTPARSAEVLVKSLNPLFGRTWTTYTGTQGEFAVAGTDHRHVDVGADPGGRRGPDRRQTRPHPARRRRPTRRASPTARPCSARTSSSPPDRSSGRDPEPARLPGPRQQPLRRGLPGHHAGPGYVYVGRQRRTTRSPACRRGPTGCASPCYPQPGHGPPGDRRQRERDRRA